MAKRDTVQQIKDKHGASSASEALSQAQLDALLDATDRPAFDRLLAEYTQPQQGPQQQPVQPAEPGEGEQKQPAQVQAEQAKPDETPEGWIRVKIGKGSKKSPVSEGAGFIHPVARRLIAPGKVVAVPDDGWTQDQIAFKVLVEVD